MRTHDPRSRRLRHGGRRADGPAGDFAPAFAIAAEAGCRSPATPVRSAARRWCARRSDAIPVKRIGHGVRAVEDPDLVRRLAGEGIVLECCPGSNVALGVFPDFAAHSFPGARAAGVKVTLNRRSALLPHHHRAGIRDRSGAFRLRRRGSRRDHPDRDRGRFCDEETKIAQEATSRLTRFLLVEDARPVAACAQRSRVGATIGSEGVPA